MKRAESTFVHASTVLVGGTGLVYAWMAYLARPQDPYALVNHPLQPQTQHLHVLFAPLLVFAIGLIWQRHVWSHYKKGVRQRRMSGISLLLSTVPMVVSGYLIQTAVDPAWRKAWVVVHLVTSGLWLFGYLAHQVVAYWKASRRRRASRPASGFRGGPGDLRPAVDDPQRRAEPVAQ